jgi:hypothetical protein
MLILIKKSFKYKGQTLQSGQELDIKCDKYGNPSELFWRNRIKDSKIDQCIEVQGSGKEKTNKSKK